MASAIRDIALHTVFTDKVKFNNNRYQHREVAARLLFLEHMQVNSGKLADTKKPYPDKMVMDYKDTNLNPTPIFKGNTFFLEEMANVFKKRDKPLKSKELITIFYLFFIPAIKLKTVILDHMQVNSGKLADTKKPYLDKMVMDYRDANLDPSPIIKGTTVVLDEMANVFTDRDELLRSQASMTVYYLLFRAAIELNNVSHITRRKLLDFYGAISENRRNAEQDITRSNYELLEFERMTQQGTNDAYSIRERTKILKSYLDE